MDDFMGKAKAISSTVDYAVGDDRMRRTEFENYRKTREELTNRRFRCVASRIKNQDERIDICMRISVLAFVASIAALVIALVV
jgi:hypothetical protein